MSDLANRAETTMPSDARTPWADPVCTEYAVADLTQAGDFGAGDGDIFS